MFPRHRAPSFCLGRHRSVLSSRAAFSLVEVALALGVVSFAILSVMALIPVGLSTLGDAKDQTTEAHILSGLAAKIGTLSFTDLAQLDSGATFDAEGQPVTANAEAAVYKVTISVGPPIYAGEPSDAGQTLQAVKVAMRNLHRSSMSTNIYTLHVAKSR